MREMEVQLVAAFPDLAHMLEALDEIRSQGALDVRILSGPPGEAGSGASAAGSAYALSVWMERSRYRRAEDTILRCQGAFLPGTDPSLIFAQNVQ